MNAPPRKSARARPKPNKPSSSASDDEPSHKRSNIRRRETQSSSLIRLLGVNLKLLFVIIVIAFFVILFLIRSLVTDPVQQTQRPRVVTPFPAPKLMDLPQFQGEHKESLYWGTYRPNVYLGIRARTPRSLIAGLMWLGVKEGKYFMRHVCQDSDELSKYGWTHHNGRDFGYQVLVDQDLTLSTSFLKSKENSSGYGGDWAVRIGVQNTKSNEDTQGSSHLFLYVADEDGNALSLGRNIIDLREDSLLASGSRLDVGDWQLHLQSANELDVHFSGFRTPHMHNLSELVQGTLAYQAYNYGRLQLSDTSVNSPNILVFQISAKIPFKTDMAFVSGINSKSPRAEERVNGLTGTSLTLQLEEKKKEFDTKFEERFNLIEKVDSESITVGKAAIANLLGGIGYFYGQSRIAIPKSSRVIFLNLFIICINV